VNISRQEWAQPTSDTAAHRRAGGRRHFNSVRAAHAELRRARVAALLAALNFRYGAQAAIARRLRVSQSTISRDVRAVLGCRPVRCPTCGCGCQVLADRDVSVAELAGLDAGGDVRPLILQPHLLMR
jgi:hypothetical protein